MSCLREPRSMPESQTLRLVEGNVGLLLIYAGVALMKS